MKDSEMGNSGMKDQLIRGILCYYCKKPTDQIGSYHYSNLINGHTLNTTYICTICKNQTHDSKEVAIEKFEEKWEEEPIDISSLSLPNRALMDLFNKIDWKNVDLDDILSFGIIKKQ